MLDCDVGCLRGTRQRACNDFLRFDAKLGQESRDLVCFLFSFIGQWPVVIVTAPVWPIGQAMPEEKQIEFRVAHLLK